ncbi:MAG: CHASE2 domain-containing protein [Desulfobacterales bacterium]
MLDSFFKKLARHHHTLIFVLIILTGLFTYSIGVPFLDLMELKTIDLRFQTRDRIIPEPAVVLAVIDEKSIAREGKWIWPRTKFADLIAELSQAGASVIAFDIGFLEPDNKRIVETIDTIRRSINDLHANNPDIENYLTQLRFEKDNDRRLAQAIQYSDAKVVLGYFFQMDPANAGYVEEEEILAHQENISHSKYSLERYISRAARQVPLIQPIYPQSNIKEISTAAQYSGYFNMIPDPDGVVRWLPGVLKFRDILYAPMALAAVGAFRDQPLEVVIDDYGVTEIRIGDLTIPTDEQGHILINYRGEEKSFPHISVTDILRGDVSHDTFKDKIVMIGVTAVGIYDLRVTPFGTIFPGLEIHANIVDSILSEDFLYQPNWAAIFDVLAIVALGVFLGIVLPRVTVVPGLAAGLGAFACYIIFCQLLFAKYGIVLNLVYPLSVVLMIYVSITAYRYFVETRQKRFIKDAFATYLAPTVVKQLIESPEHLELGGEEREITAFFSDVQGFTSISETLTPNEIVVLLNEFLTEMTDIILNHEGTVDKFEGDAIIAFFGAPNILDNHAKRACLASLEMQKRLAELRNKWGSEGRPELKMRIGISTGLAVVGNMGSEKRLDYTMMGDTVNTAARLEGVNKSYGIYTLISETTLRAAGNDIVVREIDTIKVIGRRKPVTVYELLAYKDPLDVAMKKTIARYQQGLQAYREGNWNLAIKYFKAALAILPDDGPSNSMLSRCYEYRIKPPGKDWDGSYDLRSK